MPDTRTLPGLGSQPGLAFDYLTRRRSFQELGELARTVYRHEPRATHGDPALWRAFPRGYVGCWIEGRLAGCVQLWPLDSRRANDFLLGARSERELTPDDFAAVINSPRTVHYFSGLLMAPDWQGRGLAAHLFAEAMTRWSRDLPWRPPIRFAALAESQAGLSFIRAFGMREVRPAGETADRVALYARTFRRESELHDVSAAARASADRKGRLPTPAVDPAGADSGARPEE